MKQTTESKRASARWSEFRGKIMRPVKVTFESHWGLLMDNSVVFWQLHLQDSLKLNVWKNSMKALAVKISSGRAMQRAFHLHKIIIFY